MRDLVVHNVNSNMPKEHKAVMKTDVAEHFISKFTNENDIILDCFFGYGTTGVVAKKLNRRYIGIEKEKLYYEMSVKRCDL
jgi:DNA modification methylase